MHPAFSGKTTEQKCPDGGIGRRAGLKHLWSQGRAGSTPALGTKPDMKISGFVVFRDYIIPRPASQNEGLTPIVSSLPPAGLANIFRLIKGCQTTIQRLTLFINAIAENLASGGVFTGSTLISALGFRVARHYLK